MSRPLKGYNISFTGLKPGQHEFNYHIDKEFFEAFNFDEILRSDVDIKLDFLKKSTLMELHFRANGSVNIRCDVSNEPYDQPVDGILDTVVKFGSAYNDDNDDLIILPHDEHQINVAQLIYELIVLSIPNKRIHPGIEDGTLKSEILEKLKELEPGNQNKENEIDPRWSELKKLIINKNT